MKTGIGAPRRRLARIKVPNSIFLFPFFILPVLFGCASPGEPIARRAPVPAPIVDLSVSQSGNSAVLTFTLPRDTVEQRLLKRTPEIEIYRGFSPASPQTAAAPIMPAAGKERAETMPPAVSSTPAAKLSLAMTIPSALVSHYQYDGGIHYTDPWTPEILQQHAGESVTYVVRTAEAPTKPSQESNPVSLRVYVAPNVISDLKAQLALAAIDLAWTAPQQTPVGPAPAIDHYDIYRSYLSSGAADEKSAAMPQAFPLPGSKEAAAQPIRIATTQSTAYEDTQVTLGGRYTYFVRSVVEYSGEPVESADSNAITTTMRDVYPPSVPTGPVIVPLPAQNGTSAHIDLSWDLNPETDVAGYNVYRSEQESTLGARLNSQLLPTPVFSDMSAVVGRRYFYRVTAVDRSGNESKASAAISGEIPAESQPKQ
ncbi:MAG: fibronectin type III domain-containing protein [Candidatus Acidiferrales bacterium]